MGVRRHSISGVTGASVFISEVLSIYLRDVE